MGGRMGGLIDILIDRYRAMDPGAMIDLLID